MRELASPTPRIRSRPFPSAIRAVRLPEEDHLLVLGVVPVAQELHLEPGSLAGPAEGVQVVVVVVEVVVADHALGLVDVVDELLPMRVFVDRHVELATRLQSLSHIDQASRDAVQREVGEDRLRNCVIERLAEVRELEALHSPEGGALRSQAVSWKLELASLFDHVRALVDAIVVTFLQVLDEMDAAAERAATDIEQVVLRLEAVVYEVVELELAHVVPERHVPDRPAMPVGVEVPVILAGKRSPERTLHGHRDQWLQPLEDVR